MGNSSSSPTGAAARTEPTDAQVDEVFAAIKQTYDLTTSSMDDNIDRELLMIKLRTKLEEESPSAMGAPRIDPDITACIGQTNLVRINKLAADTRVGEVVAKMEYTNPALSVKDRIAIGMLEVAESNDEVKPGETVIVDVTSGNTGIAWGMVAAAKGYRTIQIIPEPYSVERRALMMAYGVEVVVTKKEDGIGGAIKKYFELLHAQGDNGWSPRQFDNPANIASHVAHTGPEIYEQCGGKIDAIVAGYGTGGTISGVTTYLRGKNPEFKAYCVEPKEQSLLNGDEPGPHGIQGIAPPFIPDNTKVELFDEVIRCPTKEAMATSQKLAKLEGMAVGISAGANVWAACKIAERPEMAGKRIVTILPSAAERYFSTALYADLMEQAKSIEFAVVDESVKVEGINMNSLKVFQEKGVVFRDGFHIT